MTGTVGETYNETAPTANHHIGELALRKRTGASVLAVERSGVNTPNPGPDFALRAGDRLLVFGGGDAIARLRALLATPPGVG